MGRRDTPERNDWFDHDCCLVMEKNKAYKKMIQGRFTQIAEKETRKEEKKIHKKREYYNNKLTELEQLHTANESRKFLRKVNSVRKGYQPHIKTCRNKEGELISDKGSILTRWKEYMEDNMMASNPELVSESSSSAKDLEPDSDEQQPPPTLEEVTQTIKGLKNHRSPGSDNISSKLIKEGGHDLIYIRCTK